MKNFLIDKKILKNLKKGDIIYSMSKSDDCAHMGEESPGSTEQGCRLTAGEGDFKDSATENKRPVSG